MGGSSSKRPKPSYEEGELRDKSIAKKQDPKYRPKDLRPLVTRAARETDSPAAQLREAGRRKEAAE